MITLGLDIGSNSVGSAWIDTDQKIVQLGVGIFPAGVDETDTKRGSPINQKRREKRSQRRSIARRAKRKHQLRKRLTEASLLPADSNELAALLDTNPWELRRKALNDPLTPHEFGRVLIHLNQRRGALGVETDPDDEEEGKVKQAIDNLKGQLNGRTFGQFVADLMDERKQAPVDENGQSKADKFFQDPVRNRRDKFEFHADRLLIRDEFNKIWEKQKSLGGRLAPILTNELKKQFNDPGEDDAWRHKGALFGQRRTYWDTGTLGRCDLEPADQRCSIGDMYAQEFRVLETVNNIRIEERGQTTRPLNEDERAKIMAALRSQKTGSVATVRKALGIDKKAIKTFFTLNIERDPDREINTDWFYREIIHGVFTESVWQNMTLRQQDAVNRALLKFDPEKEEHRQLLHGGATKWWNLSPESADNFVAAWRKRPKIDKRVHLSRRALINLLPHIRNGLSVTEARQRFAKNGATPEQRARYDLKRSRLSKSDRYFLKKHPDLLPPAPTLANPVVRKAIHEVRRHIVAYLRKFDQKPDRIVIELTRSAKQSEKVRNNILANNRKREKSRRGIEEEFKNFVTPNNPMHRIVDRVRLWQEQKFRSAYSEKCISKDMVGQGVDLEIDHIVPLSRSQDNGFNNKVLCFRDENRDKCNATCKEWLDTKGIFAELEKRLEHLKEGNPRKWENLHRDAQTRDDWANSQLTDTAYAATQIRDYLSNALYDGEQEMQADGTTKRRIFLTKGIYTSMLRKDWQLFQTLENPTNIVAIGDLPNKQTLGEKDRGDHRHHAIDAVVIALTGTERIQQLAHAAEDAEKYKQRTGYWPRRLPLAPPWGTIAEFRRDVLKKVFDVFDELSEDGEASTEAAKCTPLVVSHRPVKRKITGYFHKEDLWGAVDEQQGVYRIRCKISELSPKMLRMPVEETDAEIKKRLFEQFKKLNHTNQDARKKTKSAFEQGRFTRRLVDPPLGKGGLVRDWNLRAIIRKSLQDNQIDLDNFSPKQIADFAQTGKLKMPSGVPIKSVIIIGRISDPVKIAVKNPYTGRQAINPRTDLPLFRFHFSRNNHHVEIMRHSITGDWSGDCITTFQAAQRVRPPKDADGNRQIPQLAVNRTSRDSKVFVMSLSEGETIHARRKDRPMDSRDAVGYFVVAKLDADRIWFAPHADARKADVQDRWDVSYSALKDCGPESDKPPYKVRVGPLGDITPFVND